MGSARSKREGPKRTGFAGRRQRSGSSTEEVWTAAHARLAAARGVYLTRRAGGLSAGRRSAIPSKYLLTNLALCGCCGGPLQVRSRGHGHGRKYFYGCSGYHERGRTVCANKADVPMDDANEIVIEALLDDVLDRGHASARRSTKPFGWCTATAQDHARSSSSAELATNERTRSRLSTAIAAGGALTGLLEALRARETRQANSRPNARRLRVTAPLRGHRRVCTE